ncbi:hypothetical protein IV203_022953 [Nitzschia inconspicua]|uniref:Uncharacterized protein n=1 Tax=Nitzschia inconspicua TaxID=303405 RepID=A0A9K3KCH2_9STRA|nr:hypothetical protein IV203_022953 [Nitzschia inconspicua]
MTDSFTRHHHHGRQDEDADADAEMVLQNVLSGLLLSSSSSEREEDKSRMTMSLLRKEQTVVEWNGIVEWIWTSITMTNNNSTNNNNNHTHIDQCWSDAMETIRRDCLTHNNIDPFELHATASQFIIFSKEDEYMIDNDKEEQITQQTTTTTRTCFRILCLFLCIIALQRCPSPVTRRYKRWQSILCETIRFFQEMILELDNDNTYKNNNNNNDDDTWMVRLWVQYQCPAALHVVQQLAKDDPATTTSTTTSTNDIQFTAIFAGLVGTTTQLAERIQFQHSNQNNDNTQHQHHHHHHDDNPDRLSSTDMSREDDTSTRVPLLQQLLGSVRSICDIFDNNNTILSIVKTNTTSSYDEMSIWRNPWRFYSYNQQQHQKQQPQQSFGNESTNEKLLSNGEDDGDDNSIIIGDNTTTQRSLSWWIYEASSEDIVASMDTSWSHHGISRLAVTAFPRRPQVYHPQFVWKVWLPHVTQIMIKDDIRPTTFQQQQQQQQQQNQQQPSSIDFLQSLLQCTPNRSLTIQTVLDWNNNSNNNDTSSKFLHERPDVPLELVQVLSDRMILVMMSHGTDSESLVLQRRKYQYVSEVANLLSNILDRYETTCQAQLVARLIHDCPNPGLQARFIDLLLRPLLSEPTCQEQLWTTFLRGQLDKLFRHLVQSSSSSSSSTHGLLTNVPELIETVEVHVSTLSLIQRWVINNNNKKQQQDSIVTSGLLVQVQDVSQRLAEFHHVLCQQLDRWNDKNTISTTTTATTTTTTTTTTKNDDDDVPDNYHRLNLLETTLQTVIPLVVSG